MDVLIEREGQVLRRTFLGAADVPKVGTAILYSDMFWATGLRWLNGPEDGTPHFAPGGLVLRFIEHSAFESALARTNVSLINLTPAGIERLKERVEANDGGDIFAPSEV